MTDIPILLVGRGGEPLGKLRLSVMQLIAEAEKTARVQGLAKSTALPLTLLAHTENAGYSIEKSELSRAVGALDQVRRGTRLAHIEITVDPRRGHDSLTTKFCKGKQELPKENIRVMIANHTVTQTVEFFEFISEYPNNLAQERYERIIGLDGHKARLLTELEMVLFPEKLEVWSRKHHKRKILKLCELQRDRVPLILLEGDIGTGKTMLGETIGDALARHMGSKAKVHLLKINTQVRGTGQVGEMSDLIVQAFRQAKGFATTHQGEPVLLMLDEADALAASRDTQQMHHEDKAGLNTVLQRLDNLRSSGLPIAVIFITNRPAALDPAIRRRAALSLFFDRPGDKTRAEIIKRSVPELHLTEKQLDELVYLTGKNGPNSQTAQFTASDITERLLTGALREAYSEDRELTPEDLIAQARKILPTPPMGQGNAI